MVLRIAYMQRKDFGAYDPSEQTYVITVPSLGYFLFTIDCSR